MILALTQRLIKRAWDRQHRLYSAAVTSVAPRAFVSVDSSSSVTSLRAAAASIARRAPPRQAADPILTALLDALSESRSADGWKGVDDLIGAAIVLLCTAKEPGAAAALVCVAHGLSPRLKGFEVLALGGQFSRIDRVLKRSDSLVSSPRSILLAALQQFAKIATPRPAIANPSGWTDLASLAMSMSLTCNDCKHTGEPFSLELATALLDVCVACSISPALPLWAHVGFRNRPLQVSSESTVPHAVIRHPLSHAPLLARKRATGLARATSHFRDATSPPPLGVSLPLSAGAFLWQARGGTWLTHNESLPPEKVLDRRRHEGRALDQQFAYKHGRHTRDVPIDVPSWLFNATLAVNSQGSLREAPNTAANIIQSASTVSLVPHGMHPAVDIPGNTSESLRFVASLWREVSGRNIHIDGLASPQAPSVSVISTAFMLAAFKLCTRSADLRHLRSLAKADAVPITGEVLNLAVRQAVQCGDIMLALVFIEDAALSALTVAEAEKGLTSIDKADHYDLFQSSRTDEGGVPTASCLGAEGGSLISSTAVDPQSEGRAQSERRPTSDGMLSFLLRQAGAPGMVVRELLGTSMWNQRDSISQTLESHATTGTSQDSDLHGRLGGRTSNSESGLSNPPPGLPLVVLRAEREITSVEAASASDFGNSSGAGMTCQPETSARLPSIYNWDVSEAVRSAYCELVHSCTERHAHVQAVSAYYAMLHSGISPSFRAVKAAVQSQAAIPLFNDVDTALAAVLEAFLDALLNASLQAPGLGSTKPSLFYVGPQEVASQDPCGASTDCIEALAACIQACGRLGSADLVWDAYERIAADLTSQQRPMPTQLAQAFIGALAADSKRPEAAIDAAVVCARLGAVMTEAALLPIIEAACSRDDLIRVFATLRLMAASAVEPTELSETALIDLCVRISLGNMPVPDILIDAVRREATMNEAADAVRRALAGSGDRAPSTDALGAEDALDSALRGDGRGLLPAAARYEARVVEAELLTEHDSPEDVTPVESISGTSATALSPVRHINEEQPRHALSWRRNERHKQPTTPVAALIERYSVFHDSELGHAVVAVLRGRLFPPTTAPKPLSGAASLALAAQTARQLCTGIIRGALQLVAAEAREASVVPEERDHETFGDDAEEGDALDNSREMLILALHEWPNPAASYAGRIQSYADSTPQGRASTMRRIREETASARAQSFAELSDSSPSTLQTPPKAPPRYRTFESMLRSSLCFADFLVQLRTPRAPLHPETEARQAITHGGQLQRLPPTYGRFMHFKRLNPDEDGTGRLGRNPVFPVLQHLEEAGLAKQRKHHQRRASSWQSSELQLAPDDAPGLIDDAAWSEAVQESIDIVADVAASAGVPSSGRSRSDVGSKQLNSWENDVV